MRQSGLLRAAACVAASFLLEAGSARAHDPDALWKIVHGRCVPDELAHGSPAPCASVDLAGGVAEGSAVLKDIEGASQYLLIPTARITGIEAPAILAADAPNFFARAWSATPLVAARLHRPLPRQDLSLAINAQSGRTQNQLHIHVDCIDAAVRDALDRATPAIGAGWSLLPVRLASHRYRAMWIAGDELGDANPFRLLAASLADPAREMGRHTLVLVGGVRDNQPGFVLLDGEADAFAGLLGVRIGPGPGSGEELQDHACRIAARRS